MFIKQKWAKNRYSASADVWSLGLVLCESILDEHPLAVANESFASLIGSLQDIKPRDEDEGVATLGTCLDSKSGFSDELKAFVDWSLVIDPSMRATPEDLMDDDWFTLHLGKTHTTTHNSYIVVISVSNRCVSIIFKCCSFPVIFLFVSMFSINVVSLFTSL